MRTICHDRWVLAERESNYEGLEVPNVADTTSMGATNASCFAAITPIVKECGGVEVHISSPVAGWHNLAQCTCCTVLAHAVSSVVARIVKVASVVEMVAHGTEKAYRIRRKHSYDVVQWGLVCDHNPVQSIGAASSVVRGLVGNRCTQEIKRSDVLGVKCLLSGNQFINAGVVQARYQMCNGPAHANEKEDILRLVVVEDGTVVGNCSARKSNVLARHLTNRGKARIESFVEPDVATRQIEIELTFVTKAVRHTNALVGNTGARASTVLVLQASHVHQEVLKGNKMI